MKYTGATGAATGALWVAPSVLGSSSAFAAGSCQKKDQVNWANMANGTLNTNTGAVYQLTPDRIIGPGTPNY